MTSHGITAPTGAPGWRPLAALAALVLAVHALVLQASPMQTGSGLGRRAESDQPLQPIVTRSIEAAAEAPKALPVALPAALPAAFPTALPAALPRPVKIPKTSPVKAPNTPPDQSIPAQAAPEIVANTEPSPPLPTAADAPAESVAASTATQAIETVGTETVTPETVAAQAPAASPPLVAAAPVSLPGSARLKYNVVGQVKNLTYQATSELLWQTSGDNYEVVSKVSAFLIGSRSWTSVGKLTAAGLAPTRFSDKFKNEQAAHFEADKGKITFSANTPSVTWMPGAQDRVSVFIQAGAVLAAQPQAYPAGTAISFVTIGPRDADNWTFVVESEEMLKVIDSQLPALKLNRKPRKEFDQRVEVWFAPSLGYLPVRIRVTNPNGDFVDQQLAGVTRL